MPIELSVTLRMDGHADRSFTIPDSTVPGYIARVNAWEPDIFYSGDEIRFANGRVDFTTPATFNNVAAGSASVTGPGGTLELEWGAIHDGSAEYGRTDVPTTSKPFNGVDKAWIGYLTAGRHWNLPVPDADIGPVPDVGDPGAAGSARLRFAAPAAIRYMAADFSSEFTHTAALYNLHLWCADQYRRCFHYYNADGTPFRASDGGEIGSYRGTGGFISSYGRPADGHPGEWTPDPMHLTVVQQVSYTVFGKSHMAGQSVRDLLEATMTQFPSDLAGPKPPRYYGLPLHCIAQAIIGLEPYFRSDATLWRGYLDDILSIYQTHAVDLASSFPVLHDVYKNDHMHVSDGMIDAAQVFPHFFEQPPGAEVTKEDIESSGVLTYFITWMGGQLCAGLADTLAVNNLPAATRSLALQMGKLVGSFIVTRCRYSAQPGMLDYNTIEAVEFDTHTKTDFPKNVSPKVSVIRQEDKSSMRGVYKSYLVPGLERLARVIDSDELVPELHDAVDSLVDSNITHGYGINDPVELAQGAWYEVALRRSLTDLSEDA